MENKLSEKIEKELDNKKCDRCGSKGFRVVDKRNNKTICITCGFVLGGLDE